MPDGAGVDVEFTSNKLPDIARRLPKMADDQISETARRTLGRMKGWMREPKSGTHWPSLPRRSSAEGESPAEQSGELIESLGREKIRDGEHAVFSTDKKSVWLEYGTENIAPRPVFGQATAFASRLMVVLLKAAFDRLG